MVSRVHKTLKYTRVKLLLLLSVHLYRNGAVMMKTAELFRLAMRAVWLRLTIVTLSSERCTSISRKVQIMYLTYNVLMCRPII